MPHNRQRKIALVNDYTGFGRCSVAVQLPIISHLRVQCCPLPTAVLSNHTMFDSFSIQDFTAHMEEHIAEWRKLSLQFAGICTGFLGSVDQIAIVERFIDEFAGPRTVVVVDPVMGDYGRPYATYTPEMCASMERLVALADIVTPNLTEASLLLGEPYRADAALEEVAAMGRRLTDMGPRNVVITGIVRDGRVVNVGVEREARGTAEPAHGEENAAVAPGAATLPEAHFTVSTPQRGGDRSGTGDVFAAIIAADAVNGVPFRASVERAAAFIGRCIERSGEMGIPATDGVAFEEVIRELD